MYKKLSIILILIIIGLTAYYNFYSTEKQIAIIDMERLIKDSERANQLKLLLQKKGEELKEEYENNENQPEDQINIKYTQQKQEIEDQLNIEIEQILKEINQNHKYSVVLYKNKVYYGGKDITNEVAQLLDEKYYEVD
ncbi:MAG: hypothetical protein KGY44_04570 [Halanaerobiales bacterium]|nr:hypothetical protein [Halanaerobiales bacterium]